MLVIEQSLLPRSKNTHMLLDRVQKSSLKEYFVIVQESRNFCKQEGLRNKSSLKEYFVIVQGSRNFCKEEALRNTQCNNQDLSWGVRPED